MAARRSTRTPATAYRCLRGFSYPASKSIRDRIRAGDHMPLEERGDWQRYEAGDRIENLPSDVSANLLKRGATEVFAGKGGGTTKGEEMTADDTQS